MTAGLLIAVLAAGGIGALLRFTVTKLFLPPNPSAHLAIFPWHVLVVNTVGSTIGGVVLGLQSVEAVSPAWSLILLTGLCGGLTTFSTFSVETVQLALRRLRAVAAINLFANLGGGLGGAWLGFFVVVSLA